MAFCSNCGNRLNDNERFCSVCGAPYEAPQQPQQPVQDYAQPDYQQTAPLQGDGFAQPPQPDYGVQQNYQQPGYGAQQPGHGGYQNPGAPGEQYQQYQNNPCQNGQYPGAQPVNSNVYDPDDTPSVGLEVMTTLDTYCPKHNYTTRKHAADEHFTFTEKGLYDIPEPWLKVVFADDPAVIDEIQAELEKSDFKNQFTMSRSTPVYYEIFAKGTNKANAITELSKITNTPLDKIIVLGDNDNDAQMLSLPCMSFCPSNASEKAERSADFMLRADNNRGVIPEVIERALKLINH